jgi:N-methylhydantoinase A
VKPIRTAGEEASHAIKLRRNVYWRELDGATLWPVYDRSRLFSGNKFTGPAIVEEPTATTVVGPGDKVTVGLYGDLIIEVARFSGGVRDGSQNG